MSDEIETPGLATSQIAEDPVQSYVSPQIERLGTLAELTQGGDSGPDDNIGGAGDEGSL